MQKEMTDGEREIWDEMQADAVDDVCKKCGNLLDWADCWQIDCEEGYYDEYEEDPINFAPGSYRKCETCEGKGGWWYCPNPSCKPVD